jgi:3-oxoacyl-[acyl-carrier protein] reductase
VAGYPRFDVVDQVALVTGAARGLGRAVALALANAGADVALGLRDLSSDAGLVAEIEAMGRQVLPVQCEVGDIGQVQAAVDAVVTRFGRLDVLVNNAGTSAALPFEGADDAAWQEDLDLKLFAALRCIRLALPLMRAQGQGRVVNVLNVGAKAPGARSLPTAASRAAGLAVTKALSKELAAERILVNAICIGIVESGQWERRWEREGRPGTLQEYYARLARELDVPLGRIAAAEELADLVLFLVSERAGYITGTAINFDGGACPTW